LELRHLLLDLLVYVIVWSCEDQRDRFGGEVAAADEPFVSLMEVAVSSRLGFGGRASWAWADGGC